MLKLFEEYNEKYYVEINGYEYESVIYNAKFVNLYHITTLLEKTFTNFVFINNYRNIMATIDVFEKTCMTIVLDIIESKDEWFYLCYLREDKYYKCDQFEGLIKCMKDILKL